MSMVVWKLPEVKSEAEARPQRCPNCQGETFQRWGGRRRAIRDPQVRYGMGYRYRCGRCGHTFRHYPPGGDQAQQSQRRRKLVALMGVLGLSHRGIAALLPAFGVRMGRMSAWRDKPAWAEHLGKRRKWKPVRVLGLDGAYVRACGGMRPVLVAVDGGEAQPVAVGYVDEYNPDAVRRFLEPLVKRLGVSVIVTDDLATYRIVAEKLGLEHPVCQFHVRRWVGRPLHDLAKTVPKAWAWLRDDVKVLLAEWPAEGGRRLFELWKHIPERRVGPGGPRSPLEWLRNVLIRLSDQGHTYRVFDRDRDVPWTNNATEQVIGRMTMRSRTVRGYKTRSGLLAGLMAAGSGMC